MTRFLSRACAIAGLVALLEACARVPVYQRGRLAHPTMAPTDGTSLARDHLYVVHEGATGGTLQATSGCGCN